MPRTHQFSVASASAMPSSNSAWTSPPPVKTVATVDRRRSPTSRASASPLAVGQREGVAGPADPDGGPTAHRPDPGGLAEQSRGERLVLGGRRPGCRPSARRAISIAATQAGIAVLGCDADRPVREQRGRHPDGRPRVRLEAPLERGPEVLGVRVHPVEPVDHRRPAELGLGGRGEGGERRRNGGRRAPRPRRPRSASRGRTGGSSRASGTGCSARGRRSRGCDRRGASGRRAARPRRSPRRRRRRSARPPRPSSRRRRSTAAGAAAGRRRSGGPSSSRSAHGASAGAARPSAGRRRAAGSGRRAAARCRRATSPTPGPRRARSRAGCRRAGGRSRRWTRRSPRRARTPGRTDVARSRNSRTASVRPPRRGPAARPPASPTRGPGHRAGQRLELDHRLAGDRERLAARRRGSGAAAPPRAAAPAIPATASTRCSALSRRRSSSFVGEERLDRVEGGLAGDLGRPERPGDLRGDLGRVAERCQLREPGAVGEPVDEPAGGLEHQPRLAGARRSR